MPPRAQADARLGAARPQCAVGAGADMHAAAALFCLTEVKCPCLDACACGSLITKQCAAAAARRRRPPPLLTSLHTVLRSVNRKDRATYLPKSGTGRSHFASLYPLIVKHFAGIRKSERTFWQWTPDELTGSSAKCVRYYRDPSVAGDGGGPVRDPPAAENTITKMSCYPDARGLDATTPGDNAVVRHRLALCKVCRRPFPGDGLNSIMT